MQQLRIESSCSYLPQYQIKINGTQRYMHPSVPISHRKPGNV